VHALKAAELRMFGLMLEPVGKQRDQDPLPQVADPAQNMTSHSEPHEQQTEWHDRAGRHDPQELRRRARLTLACKGSSRRASSGERLPDQPVTIERRQSDPVRVRH
jgi:hypothetical protein